MALTGGSFAFIILATAACCFAHSERALLKDRGGNPQDVLVDTVRGGNSSKVEELLREGTDPDVLDSRGRLALVEAMYANDESIVDMLIDHGADLDKKDGKGHVPLIEAIKIGFPHFPITMSLLVHEADPNVVDSDLNTPLLAAISRGSEYGVTTLLGYGANPNTPDGQGRPPIVNAARRELLVAITALVNSGADVNEVGTDGRSALIEAARTGEASVARFLLKSGAHVDAQALDGTTALLEAAANYKDVIVKILVEHGANLDHRDKNGKSALDLACERFGRWTSTCPLLQQYTSEHAAKQDSPPATKKHRAYVAVFTVPIAIAALISLALIVVMILRKERERRTCLDRLVKTISLPTVDPDPSNKIDGKTVLITANQARS